MKTWLYHKDEKAMIFDTDTNDMAALHEAGWRESPDEAKLVEPEKEPEKEPDPKNEPEKGSTKTETTKTTKKA